MAFNGAMTEEATSEDAARIARLGGPAKLADLLGYDKQGGTQRVHNWIGRGIPSAVKVEHPELFLVPLKDLPQAAQPAECTPLRRATDVPSEASA